MDPSTFQTVPSPTVPIPSPSPTVTTDAHESWFNKDPARMSQWLFGLISFLIAISRVFLDLRGLDYGSPISLRVLIANCFIFRRFIISSAVTSFQS